MVEPQEVLVMVRWLDRECEGEPLETDTVGWLVEEREDLVILAMERAVPVEEKYTVKVSIMRDTIMDYWPIFKGPPVVKVDSMRATARHSDSENKRRERVVRKHNPSPDMVHENVLA